MKENKTTKNILILVLIIIIFAFDQITKDIVRQRIDTHEQISVIGSMVTLTKVENTGAFLSLGNNMPRIISIIVMVLLPLCVIGYALFYLFTSRNLTRLFTVGICLILGGGIGNIFDRILYGSVTDFLYFDFFLFHTGIVNIADISVTAGFFVLLYDLIINKRIKTQKDIIEINQN